MGAPLLAAAAAAALLCGRSMDNNDDDAAKIAALHHLHQNAPLPWVDPRSGWVLYMRVQKTGSTSMVQSIRSIWRPFCLAHNHTTENWGFSGPFCASAPPRVRENSSFSSAMITRGHAFPNIYPRCSPTIRDYVVHVGKHRGLTPTRGKIAAGADLSSTRWVQSMHNLRDTTSGRGQVQRQVDAGDVERISLEARAERRAQRPGARSRSSDRHQHPCLMYTGGHADFTDLTAPFAEQPVLLRIAMFREPVSRVWSEFYHSWRTAINGKRKRGAAGCHPSWDYSSCALADAAKRFGSSPTAVQMKQVFLRWLAEPAVVAVVVNRQTNFVAGWNYTAAQSPGAVSGVLAAALANLQRGFDVVGVTERHALAVALLQRLAGASAVAQAGQTLPFVEDAADNVAPTEPKWLGTLRSDPELRSKIVAATQMDAELYAAANATLDRLVTRALQVRDTVPGANRR